MSTDKPPRQARTYRAARRNVCLRKHPKSTWSSDWYVPGHRARYGRGHPSFMRIPGRYPASLASEASIIRNAKRTARKTAGRLRSGLMGLR